jgi:hypothetical protein
MNIGLNADAGSNYQADQQFLPLDREEHQKAHEGCNHQYNDASNPDSLNDHSPGRGVILPGGFGVFSREIGREGPPP